MRAMDTTVPVRRLPRAGSMLRILLVACMAAACSLALRAHAQGNSLMEADRAAIAAELAKSGYVTFAGLTESRIDNPAVGPGSDGQSGDQFGQVVAVNGNTAIVGAPADNVGQNQQQGSVYVFVRSGTAWSLQAKLVAPDGAAGDSFGNSVALSGDTALIGAFQHSVQLGYREGAAYVFHRSGTAWALQKTLSAGDGSTCGGGQFGASVALSGDTALVGETRNCTTLYGLAHVFVRNGTNWSEQAALHAGDASAYDQSSFASALALDGDIAVVGAMQWYDGVGTRPGSAYVFARSGTTWTQQAQLFSDDNEANSYYGVGVAVSGTTIAVAAPMKTVGSNAYQGAVYMYVQSGSAWTSQQKVTTTDGLNAGYFGNYQGNGVTLSGDTLAVGASNGTSGISGARAYIFTRSAGVWTQRKIIRGGAGNTQFGSTGIALDGSTIVAGAPGNPDCGVALVQTGSGATWNPQGTLDRGCSPVNGAGTYGFGGFVAVDGDIAVVGAPYESGSSGYTEGRAYVLVRNGNGWVVQQRLTAEDASSNSQFGSSLAISGERIAIGAPYHQNNSTGPGTVYVFARSGSSWIQEASLTRSVNTGYGGFGVSIDLAGDTLLVGSPADAEMNGAAYVFVRSGSTWSQQTMLSASDGTYSAGFGNAVAIDADTALIGARYDTISGRSSQGSAYVFVRSGNNWAQQQKLVAPDGATSDYFGSAVAIDGDSAVVGAPYHQAGTGTTGQAYVWVRSGSTWSRQATLSEGGANQYGTSVAISGDTLAVGSPGGYQYLYNGGAYVYWRSGTAWSQHDELANPAQTTTSTYDYFGQSVAISGGLTFIGAPAVAGLPPYGNPGDGAAFAYAYVEATTTTIDGVAPEPSHVGTAATVNVTVDAERVAATSGTVTVNASTGENCTIGTLSGTAGATTSTGSCTITFATLGTRTLTASYSGAATYDPSTSAAVSHVVDKAPTTLTIASDTPAPSVVGQPYTITIALTGGFNASGTVAVGDGSANCTITLPATSCNLVSTSAGTKTITASYAGDAMNLASSATAAHTVNKAATSTTITAHTPNPSEVGQPYTVTVALAVTAPGAGTPAGNIAVSDGSASCTIVLPATSCALTSTTTGNKTLVATYAGDANFAGSASAGVSHTVSNHLTTTAITGVTPSPSVVGQAVAVAFSVTATSGTPTGNVTVSASSGESCSATVAAGTCSLTFAGAGTKTLTATYAGDSNFAGSNVTATHAVNKGNVTVSVSATPEPSVIGQAINVTVAVAAIAPAGGTPGGSVNVTAGSASCSVTLSGGSGSCSLTPTAVGSLTISASYAGDANFNSGSGSGTHTVDKGNVNVTVSETPATTVVGQSFSVNVSVAAAPPAAGMPGGSVSVTAGGANCTATLSGGSGACSLVASAAGTLTVNASYAGDGSFNSGNGSHAHTVNKAATSTTITAHTPNPSEVGQPYTVTVALAVTAPGAGTPAGNIAVSDGSASCTIVLPATSCALTSTTTGNKTLVATYAGDANFAGSASAGVSHTVNGRATTSAITSTTPSPSVVGQAVAVAFSVTASSGTPTGNVTVSASSGESCSATVAAGTCSLTFAGAGSKTLTATYAGDSNFAGSNGTATHTVNKGDVTVGVTVAPSGSVAGQPLAITTTVAAAAPAAGMPGGSVHITAGASSCSATLSGGSATCSITPVHAGALSIQASYAGDSNFNAGNGSAAATIAKATTSLVIVSHDPDPSVPGASVDVVANLSVVAPGAGVPTGGIDIGDGVDSCTIVLPATHCSLTLHTPGMRTLAASYGGDGDFAGSSASAGHEVLGTVDLSIGIDDEREFVRVGEPVIYEIVVRNTGPQDALGAQVADVLPPTLQGASWTCIGADGGTCAASGEGEIAERVDLPAGASVTFVLTATLGDGPDDTLVNQATVTAPAGTTDSDLTNNSATDTDAIVVFRDGFDGDDTPLAVETLATLGVGGQSLPIRVEAPMRGWQILLALADAQGREYARLMAVPLPAGRVQMLWLVHEPEAAWSVAQSLALPVGATARVGWTQVRKVDGRTIAEDFSIDLD